MTASEKETTGGASSTDRVTGTDGKEYDVTYKTTVTVDITALTPVGSDVVPPEPPVVNTKGEVTNFKTACDASFQVGGVSVVNNNANKSWSIQNPDKYTLRYEVRSGDRYSSSSWTDPTTSERSEIAGSDRITTGRTLTVEYGFLIEPGPANTARFCCIGQWHQSKGSGGPPFAFGLSGERLQVDCIKPNGVEWTIWKDTNNIQRGRLYQIKSELVFNANGTGSCKVWRDGTQLVNYSGGLGTGVSGETYYWKNGVYRYEAPETMAAQYKNLQITVT